MRKKNHLRTITKQRAHTTQKQFNDIHAAPLGHYGSLKKSISFYRTSLCAIRVRRCRTCIWTFLIMSKTTAEHATTRRGEVTPQNLLIMLRLTAGKRIDNVAICKTISKTITCDDRRLSTLLVLCKTTEQCQWRGVNATK